MAGVAPRLDLDAESRRALEFDAVLDAVAGHAVTGIGASRVRALAPVADAAALRAAHGAVEEASRHVARLGRLLPGGLPDPEPALRALAVEGLAVEALALRDLASVLHAAADVRAALSRLPADEYPALRALGASVPDLRSEAGRVLAGIGPEGRLADDASPELRRIRRAIARVGEHLRRMLESRLREPGAEAVIRDEFVTQRNGRFVIPVRADAPRAVRGIVHAASSSGATLFVEPLDSVEPNNELVRLTEEETAESGRVLEGWARRLRDRGEEVSRAVERLSEADSLQARALFAAATGAVRPEVEEGRPLLLRDARHPLLERRLREQGKDCVPVSFALDPADQVLVVSGPNAGGKTVALKTFGLAALMAHAGLPVLAAEARLPLFRQARADIGDHQSIEADLSTFTAHVKAVGSFLAGLTPPALLLFDEIGTGTEPTEGGSLAQAVLEKLRRSGVTAVATTHLAALKAWAFTTPGAASAAMEFDEETLRPTFRILMGAAGVSAGIEIASRLGLSGEIVARARALMGEGGRRAESFLARIRDLTAELEERRSALAADGEALREERTRIAARAEADAERIRREAARELEEALAEFREQSSREIRAIRGKRERLRAEKDHVRSEMRLRAELSRKVGRVAPPAADGPPALSEPFEPRRGARVLVRSLDREGIVADVKGERVEVRFGSVGVAVRRSDLRPAGEAAKEGARGAGSPRPAGAARGPGLDDDVPLEIVVIGKTVDEALPEIDRFLDRAAMAGRNEVRIVHGHGTGRLRSAVRRFLAGHAHVASHRPGAPREGGDGATVVEVR